MRVLGIDPGARLGLAVLSDGKPSRIWTEELDCAPTVRLGLLYDRMHAALLTTDQGAISLAVIEGYAFAAKGKTFQIGEMGGVIRLALVARKVPFVVVASSSLKKFVMGQGSKPGQRIEKVQMAVAVNKRWGVTAHNDNEYDAYGLARVGLGIMGVTKGLIASQIEVVKKYAAEVQKAHCNYDCTLSDPQGA